jgi:aspartate 1-decarboxylase
MIRQVLKSKLHRATVTGADVEYEGSVTIDEDLLEAADLRPYEAVHIWNVTRGTRLVTYAITGARGSRTICINGAAAHLCKVGDTVILASFCDLTDAELQTHKPRLVYLGPGNVIKAMDVPEVPGPARRADAAGVK